MKTTFNKAFLAKDCDIIKVPRLQRDYVQGTNTGVKEGFCQSIISAIDKDNRIPMDLNFVYGLHENQYFIPIDGQQRLTTLWILHLYIHSRSSSIDEICQFQYFTRDSARLFCDAIRLHLRDICHKDTLNIEDQKWYYDSWSKDTTVVGIIATLTYFHDAWKSKEVSFFDEAWKLLCSNDCAITFTLINNKDEELNKDIYLKMNSRGRALSEFEKLKSWLDERLPNASKDEWQSKVDNEWTDMIWRKRVPVKVVTGEEVDSIDLEQLRLVYNLLATFWTLNYIDSEESKDIIIKADKLESTSELLGFAATKRTNAATDIRDFQLSLIAKMVANNNYSIPLYILDNLNLSPASCFDKAIGWYNSIEQNCDNIEQVKDILSTGEKSVFYKYFLDVSHSYPDAVIFMAILLYIHSEQVFFSNTPDNNFRDWVRVVRNIVINSSIETVDSYIGAVNLVNELSNCLDSKYNYNIYNYLARATVISKYAQSQVNEERYKASIIYYECTELDQSLKTIIHKMEDLRFLRGKIEFAFYCVNIFPDPEKYEKGIFAKCKDKFESVYQVIKDSICEKDNISDDFRRILFACDDHKFYEYWGSYSYSLETTKRRAIKSYEDLYNCFKSGYYSKYLKEAVLHIVDCNNSEIDAATYLSSLEYGDDVPNWVIRLIKEPKLLKDHCGGYHNFTIKGGACYLFNSWVKPADFSVLHKVD